MLRDKLRNCEVEKKRRAWRQQNFTCHWCRVEYPPENVTTDHVIPLRAGGDHLVRNIVASCLRCNQARNAADNVSRKKTKYSRKLLPLVTFYLEYILEKDPYAPRLDMGRIHKWVAKCEEIHNGNV